MEHKSTRTSKIFTSKLEQELEETIGGKIKTYGNIQRQNHSMTGDIIFEIDKEEKYFFFKKSLSDSITSDDINKIHRREVAVLDTLGTIDEIKNRVPKLEYRITNPSLNEYLIIMEHLGSNNDRDELLQISQNIRYCDDQKKKEELKEQKRLYIRESTVQIAELDGLLRENQNIITKKLEGFFDKKSYTYKKLLQQERVFNYLLRIIHYHKMGGKEGNPFNPTKKTEYLTNIESRFNLDLNEEVNRIFTLRDYALNLKKNFQSKQSRIRFVNGDARPHHGMIKRGKKKYCDWEDCGPYPWYQDIVSFYSSDVSLPEIQDLPNLSKLFLLVEKRAGDDSRLITHKRDLQQIFDNISTDYLSNSDEITKLLYDTAKFTIEDIAEFITGTIFGMIVDNDIITDGVKKKYSEEQLKKFYPHLTVDEIHQLGPNNLQEKFQLLTPAFGVPVLDYCSQSENLRELFYTVGNIYQKTEIVEIKNLEELKKSKSAWYNLFRSPDKEINGEEQ